MSFLILNCMSDSLLFRKRTRQITLGIDLSLIISLSVIGGLVLGKITNLGLPAQNPILPKLGSSFVALGGSVALGDLFPLIFVKQRKINEESVKNSEKTISWEMIKEAITNCAHLEHSIESVTKSKNTSCEPILNGLYLGSINAFTQMIHQENVYFKKMNDDKNDSPHLYDTSNPQQFSSIVTLCPLDALQGVGLSYFSDQEQSAAFKLDLETCKRTFADKKINWIYAGAMSQDNPDLWKEFVSDATFLDNSNPAPLSQTFEECQTSMDQLNKLKREKVEGTPVKDWFKTIFEEIDQGVRGEKRVLVHCKRGESRSATILAAYLINRFGVTTKEAMNFLKTKRACVDSKFVSQLEEYETRLKQERGIS